jgi:replicative DNA helicase
MFRLDQVTAVRSIEQMETRMQKPVVQDTDSERAVLGSLMYAGQCGKDEQEAMALLSPDSFSEPQHVEIYRAIESLIAKGLPCDESAVASELTRAGALTVAGGRVYLEGMTAAVYTNANICYHARNVRDYANRRAVRAVCMAAYNAAGDPAVALVQAIAAATHGLQNASAGGASKVYSPLRKHIVDAIAKIEAARTREDGVTGLPTGFDILDEMTGGLQPGQFVVVAARPSMGKTAFACDVLRYAAIHAKVNAAFASLEMQGVQVATRLLGASGGICSVAMSNGRMSSNELSRLGEAIGMLSEGDRIHIADMTPIATGDLSAATRALHARHGLGLLVVDYLQLLQGDNQSERNRERQP